MTLHGRYTTIEGSDEVSQKKLITDVRSSSQRMRDWIVYPPNFAKLMLGLALLCFALPFFLPLLFFALLAFIDEFQKTAQYLPMRYPAWAKIPDPGLLHPGTDKPMMPTGVMYFGIVDARDPYERGKQVFLSADDLTRHMLVLGTTGSGKSEFLKGMTFNVLCWASGFFVADAKADNKLPTDMYSQVRMFARDYDFLVVNYLLGGSSPTQIANMRERLSNGLQPATAADADTLVQMTSNIMVKASGDSKTWQDRGLNLFRGICRALTHKRDMGELTLAIETLREYLALDKIEELYVEGYKLANGGPWPTPYLGVKSYLEVGLPGFQLQNMLRKHGCLKDEEEDAGPFGRGPGGPPAKKPPTNQSNECYNQHGYRADQVYPALSLLIDTYGHIFKRKHPEVDLQDVVVNNRVCVSLIPSLEKGSQEQESLGKLNLALLRVMMARALGSSIEGDVEANVDSKITASATPFALFLDEFAYQFAEGIALTAAQARSLNFFLCALAQDLEKLTEGDRAAEAGAMMANQATKFFMKIVGSDKTHELAQKTLGEGEVAVLSGFERNLDSLFGSIRRDINFKIEKRPRIGRKVLEELASGFATFAYRERAHVMRTFYPSPEVPRVRYPRINRFLQIHDLGETSMLTSTVELVPNADKALLDRIRGILESGAPPAYPELVTSDVIQNIAAAARNMNPHTPAIERGIVLYEAGVQALRLARSASSTVLGGGSGSAAERMNQAPAGGAAAQQLAGAGTSAFAGHDADMIAEMEQFNSGSAAGVDSVVGEADVEPVSDVLGVTGGLEERLAGFDPLAPTLRAEPPIVRKDKALVFGDEMGIEASQLPAADLSGDALGSGVALSDAELLDGDSGLGAMDSDDDAHWVLDDAALATSEPEFAEDTALPLAQPEGQATPAQPAPGEGGAGALSGRDAEQLAAGLQALARTKVDAEVIDRLGPEVIGLRDNAKSELANLEVTLGATPAAAEEASKNTEKAVAQGLSLLDNNKTKTSSADFEALFSEFDVLLETK